MFWLQRSCFMVAAGLFLFPFAAQVFELPLAFQIYDQAGTLHGGASNELRQFALANYWLPSCWLSAGFLLIGAGLERRGFTLTMGAGLLLLFPLVHYAVARLSAILISGCYDCRVFGPVEIGVDVAVVALGLLALKVRRARR